MAAARTASAPKVLDTASSCTLAGSRSQSTQARRMRSRTAAKFSTIAVMRGLNHQFWKALLSLLLACAWAVAAAQTATGDPCAEAHPLERVQRTLGSTQGAIPTS